MHFPQTNCTHAKHHHVEKFSWVALCRDGDLQTAGMQPRQGKVKAD
jgi:hypothetical protein